jgi:hypothetical protein
MKKIDLLLTGAALGGVEGQTGKCSLGCFDISGLVNHPSSLIWSDTIILTDKLQEDIENFTKSETQKYYSTAICRIFEIAKEYNIVKIKNPDSILIPDLMEKINKELELDYEILPKIYPRTIKAGKDVNSSENIIFVENEEYCKLNVQQIYASLILAKKWNSELLFSDRIYNYCKYKFGLSLFTGKHEKIKAFDNIFNIIIPDKPIMPFFAMNDVIGNKVKYSCKTCDYVPSCKSQYLKILEDNVHSILDLREKDEIQQIKGVIQDITGQLEQAETQFDYRDIIREFRTKERIYNRDLKSAFPKVKRFTNIAIYASIPAILLGQATGLPLVSYAAVASAGITTATKELIDYSKSKYKWVGFLQKARKKNAMEKCTIKK